MENNIQETILNNSLNSNNITNITNHASHLIEKSSFYFLNTSNITHFVSQVDPNWFYSASAQSAATIVGLMGAFLTTKVLNQKSYLKQLKNDISELEQKKEHVSTEIQNIKEKQTNLLTNKEVELCKKINPSFTPSILPDYDLQRIEKSEGGKNILEKLTKYREYDDVIISKKGEQLFLNNLLTYKKEQVITKEDFSNSKVHFINLVIFSIIGVFAPLFMMLLDFETMIKYRVAVFILILCGWVIILYSLISEIKNLRD